MFSVHILETAAFLKVSNIKTATNSHKLLYSYCTACKMKQNLAKTSRHAVFHSIS